MSPGSTATAAMFCLPRWSPVAGALLALAAALLLLADAAAATDLLGAAPGPSPAGELPPEAIPAWTNHAGLALRAIPERLDGDRVKLSGSWYDLGVFPDSEQARLRAWFGDRPIRPADAQVYTTLRWMLDRNNSLEAEGVVSPEEAAARRKGLLAAIEALYSRAEAP